MSPALVNELTAALQTVARQHEVVTCWATMFLPGELHFIPLPAEMWEIIRSSEDYRELIPGNSPTLFSIASGDEVVELMAYHAAEDGNIYMLAPIKPVNNPA